MGRYLPIMVSMRRSKDKPIPLELDILRTAQILAQRGMDQFHGHLLAKEMAKKYNARKLVGYGTLYKALDRLERRGFLESKWEAPSVAAEECRPRRRFYRIPAENRLEQPVNLL